MASLKRSGKPDYNKCLFNVGAKKNVRKFSLTRFENERFEALGAVCILWNEHAGSVRPLL